MCLPRQQPYLMLENLHRVTILVGSASILKTLVIGTFAGLRRSETKSLCTLLTTNKQLDVDVIIIKRLTMMLQLLH